MSSLLSAGLTATCSALGYFNKRENKYYADQHILETVKDLIRYLKRDDETHDIRRHLGDTKVLQTDLLPLLKTYWEDVELFDVLLRLIVNLTTPTLILWQEQLPTEKTERNHLLKIEEHLHSYKQAFADELVWSALDKRLRKIFAIDPIDRSYEDGLIIERILIVIRNVLYVPSNDAEKRPDNDASVQDQVLWALHKSEILDSVLFMASSESLQVYYMHILEILYFMLREQNAAELANTALQRSQTEKIRDEAELLDIRHREMTEKQEKIKMYNGTRHSRFGGTFVIQSMKSISDKELIYHKPLNKLDSLKFDSDKKKSKIPKNRVPVQSNTTDRRSAFSIRLFLKVFSVEFLNASYNPFMKCIKDNLVRAKAQAHDESYYLWALRFFMEFNRCYKFEVKLVSETVSAETFHFVQKQIEDNFGLLSTDKKKVQLWSRRLHLALLAYRELLLTLCAMDKSDDQGVRNSARVIKSRIFYVLEYRELILTLLITFDELKTSQLYLNDLIETQHIFLKMLQNFCGSDGTVIVQKKSKAKRRRKKKAAAAAAISDDAALRPNLEGLWDEVSPQLSTVLGETMDFPTDVVPFDATSELPIDEQKADAMKKIQRHLRNSEFESAIALLRAAREVWPENDCFGAPNMVAEEEFLALQDIFFADLGENDVPPSNETAQTAEEVEEEDEAEEYAGLEDYEESDFKLEDFIKRLAHPKVVRACSLALSNFQHNSVNTNHCIVKLLHRIAFDCKMYVMVFQASIFRTFQKIYSAKVMPQYKELVKFATYIMRQFFKVAKTNPKVYMEALFWTSSKDAIDIEEGYGSYQEKSAAAAKAWTEIEEDELRRLFMEHREKQLQDDVIDWILNNLIDNTRTRRAIIKKLKEMYLLTDYKGPRKSASGRAPIQWSSEEETQLAELYEQFKDASDPLGCIMSRLETRRPKNRVVEKLLVMGLVQDKKELRKKRVKKSQQNRGSGNPNNSVVASDDSSSDSDDDDDRNSVSGTSQQQQQQQQQQKKTNKIASSKHRKTTKSKRSSQIKALSTRDISKCLLTVVNAGMNDALEWLKESFEDASEDVESSVDDESIPLVPILECSVEAIENEDFQALLKAFGITSPFDEQESYWRIPSTMTSNLLTSYCDLITKALNGTLATVEEANAVSENALLDKNDESSDEDVFENLRRFHSDRMQENFDLEEVQNTNEDIQLSEGRDEPKLKKKRKSRVVKMSEEENSEAESASKNNDIGLAETDEIDNSRPNRGFLDSDSENETPNNVLRKNNRKLSDSEDESENDNDIDNTNKRSSQNNNSDSDSEKISQNSRKSSSSIIKSCVGNYKRSSQKSRRSRSPSDFDSDDQKTSQSSKKSKSSTVRSGYDSESIASQKSRESRSASSSDDQRTSQKSNKSKSSTIRSDDDSENVVSQKSKRSRSSSTSDSDSDDQKTTKSSGKSKSSANDSDNDNENDPSQNSKRSRSTTPDTDFKKPQKKKTRIILSDDED